MMTSRDETSLPKLQSEKSLWDSFRPINIISSIFGISYFSANNSILSRILKMLYTLTLFAAFTGSFFYRISSVTPKFCASNAVAISVMGIQQILAFIVIVTIYYQVIFYNEKFRDLFKLISVTEIELHVLNIQLSYKHFTLINLCEVIIVTVFIYVSFIFFSIYYKVQYIEVILLELFSSINPMLVIILNVLTFANLARVIRDRFQMLKNFLVDVCAIDSLVVNDSNKVWKVKLTRVTPHGLYSEFKKIAQIYELLFSMVNHLNYIFGFSNLASMGENAFFFCSIYVMFFFQTIGK